MNAEYTLRRKDTGETWVGSYNFGPIRDRNGMIVGSVVTGRDITERKLAEQERRERTTLLRVATAWPDFGDRLNPHRNRVQEISNEISCQRFPVSYFLA